MINFAKELHERYQLQEEYLGIEKGINLAEPLVSVSVTTYQHAHFIQQCLDGILAQTTNFPYEVIIGEDGSEDGTREICVNYAAEYPDRIRLFLRDRKTSVLEHDGKQHRFNGQFNSMSTRGKYIALCEGDDYWTDPLKLQKQADFLEAHPECSLCYHNVKRFFPDNTRAPDLLVPADRKTLLSINDIVLQNPIPTPSVMFRNGLLGQLPEWYYGLALGDWPLWVLLAQHGQAGYINETMAAYRVHSGGVHSGTPLLDWLPRMRQVHDAIDRGLDYKYHDIVEQGKERYVIEAAESLCPRSFVGTSPREAAQALHQLAPYTATNPRLMATLRRRFYAVCFFRAAKLGDYRAVRQSLLGLALYGSTFFRNRGMRSIAARALLGQRLTSGLRKLARLVRT